MLKAVLGRVYRDYINGDIRRLATYPIHHRYPNLRVLMQDFVLIPK